jgi:DNA-directed RNA polymerase sigma subunit (sigma70/sigma32)
LTQELGKEASADDLADFLDMSREEVEQAIRLGENIPSLSRSVSVEDDRELGDLIEDKYALSPEEIAHQEVVIEEVERRLSILRPKNDKTKISRDEDIIRRRFGIGFDYAQTLQEVGDFYRITRERVRQIEIKMMKKLRDRVKSSESFPELYEELPKQHSRAPRVSRKTSNASLETVVRTTTFDDGREDVRKSVPFPAPVIDPVPEVSEPHFLDYSEEKQEGIRELLIGGDPNIDAEVMNLPSELKQVTEIMYGFVDGEIKQPEEVAEILEISLGKVTDYEMMAIRFLIKAQKNSNSPAPKEEAEA